MDFLDKVENLLARNDMNQRELESLAGLPTNRISKWKNAKGKIVLPASYALAMAKVLGVEVEYLIDDTLAERPEPPAPPPVLDAEEFAVLTFFRTHRDELTADIACAALRYAARHAADPVPAVVPAVTLSEKKRQMAEQQKEIEFPPGNSGRPRRRTR